ncbi:MAG: hypothetical protein Q9163_004894 [Psora crenata]
MAEVVPATSRVPTHTPGSDSPIRIDWATCPSDSNGSSEQTGAIRRDAFTTPPQKFITSESRYTDDRQRVTSDAAPSTAKRVYDIPTLMKYQTSLAENLFQYIGFNRSLRTNVRSRGLSEVSNLSHGSTYSHDGPRQSFGTKIAGQPQRQPLAPPENRILQQNTGFARFLKQHASPPHHRVTAGGRIVPAGPLSPPPMFDYASLTGMLKDRSSKPRAITSKERPLVPSLPGREGYPQTEPAVAICDRPQTHNSLPLASQPFQVMRGNLPPLSTDYGPQPTVTQSLQPQPSLAPLGIFEDGSIMASCNGTYYRTYWNGLGTVIEPLQITSAQPIFPTANILSPHASLLANRTASASSTSYSQSQPAPLVNATNRTRGPSGQSRIYTYPNGVDADYAKFKADLQELDKHLALHHYDLAHDERASLVCRRRALVEQMDAIRRGKGVKQDVPLDTTASGMAGSSRNCHFPSGIATQAVQGFNNGVLASPQTLKTDISRKPLSPSAPPFVPKSMTPIPTSQIPKRHVNSGWDAPTQISSSFQAQLPLDTPGNTAQLSSSSCTRAMSSRNHGVDEPFEQGLRDPAMRIIHQSDVEYAHRYLSECAKGEKRYCTSVSEFQEAIRRVREQARLYGCAGGSSKDPAYDAEQDIWWAICDRDPIPLPLEIPDHVAKPRPWDWNDSAFNYRRAHVASTKPDTPRMDASASQQVPGGDLARTDKPETIVDVARSFCDRHRQLAPIPPCKDTDVDNTDRMPPPSSSDTTEHGRYDGLPGNLDDQELEAVQNAIEVLNKRSDAIMAQTEASGTLFSHPSPTCNDATGASRFQLALQNYTRAQKSRDHADRAPSTTTAKARDSNQALITKSLHSVPTTNIDTRRPLRHPFAENSVPHGSFLSDGKPKDIVGGSHHAKGAIPKRRSSVRKSTSITSRRSTQQSLRKSQQGKKKAHQTFEERLGDKYPSTFIENISTEPSRASVELDSPKKRKRPLSPRKAAKKAKALFQKGRPKTPQPSNVSFLREMLKSPRFSSGHLHTPSAVTSYSKSYEVSRLTMLQQKREDIQANKENTCNETSLEGETSGSGIPGKGVPIDDHNGLLSGKARSSLAAAIYHASGVLPQYDGAGRAHTSTIHQQKGNQCAHRQARVNLPGRSSYEDRPFPLGSKSHNANRGSISCYSKSTSLSLALDGSGESPSKKQEFISNGDPKNRTHDEERVNILGVTTANPDQRHPNHNSALPQGHMAGVANDIPERETEYMTVRKRQNTKTA